MIHSRAILARSLSTFQSVPMAETDPGWVGYFAQLSTMPVTAAASRVQSVQPASVWNQK